MKLRELKDTINKVHEDFLDLEVRVIADHGQVAMSANTASVEYIEEDKYIAELLHEDDVEDDSIKVFVIGD